MGHLKKLIGVRPVKPKAHPYSRFTKAELWACIEELEEKLSRSRRGLQEAASLFHGRGDPQSRNRMSEIAGRTEFTSIKLTQSK